jgi:hypothetical protein
MTLDTSIILIILVSFSAGMLAGMILRGPQE